MVLPQGAKAVELGVETGTSSTGPRLFSGEPTSDKCIFGGEEKMAKCEMGISSMDYGLWYHYRVSHGNYLMVDFFGKEDRRG